jgi:outer membrane protein TolC
VKLLILFLVPFVAQAEKLDLPTAISRAMSGNQNLYAQRLQEKQAAQDVRRASGEFGPHITAMMGIGPITKAEGNANYSVEDKGALGRILLGKVELLQPIYTWGRKTNYENAARAGVHVKQAETRIAEAQLRYEVKEAYYGFQIANSLLDFIAGGKAELVKSIEERKKKKKDSAKEDYRLEIFFREVESREAEVRKHFEMAKEAFALRLGEPRGSVIPSEEWLLPAKRTKQSAEYYVGLSRGYRSEFSQLGEGIFAKRSLAKAERKAMFPILALVASYEMADTNVRPHQPGVFAYDPYNRETWTLGVGFKIDFQWELQDAKAAKLRAEAEELEAKEVYAKQGIEVDVRRAYLGLKEAEERLEAATEAYKTGKKWLTGEAIAFGSGLGGVQGLVEAYGARAETAKSYFEAVFRHHMAWADLSRAVGKEIDPLLIP